MQKYTYIIWQIVEVGIIFTGYKYSINTRRAERVYWRCVLRQCVATLITLNDILMSLGQNHNHTADVVSLSADIFVYQVKKRCREHVTPMPIIYDEEIGCLSDRDYDEDVGEMIRKIPTFERCRGSLYRSRSKLIPKLPKSQQDVNLQCPFTETSVDERFILCDDANDQNRRILIFATDDNLRRFCDSSIIFADGTFYSCPEQFDQLYSFHAM